MRETKRHPFPWRGQAICRERERERETLNCSSHITVLNINECKYCIYVTGGLYLDSKDSEHLENMSNAYQMGNLHKPESHRLHPLLVFYQFLPTEGVTNSVTPPPLIFSLASSFKLALPVNTRRPHHSWFPYWTRWAGRFWSWELGRWEPAGWRSPCSCRRRPAGPLRSGAGWQRWWPGQWTGAPGWRWWSPRSISLAWRPGTSTSWTAPVTRSARWRRSQCQSAPAAGPSGTGSQPGSGPEPWQTGGLNRK